MKNLHRVFLTVRFKVLTETLLCGMFPESVWVWHEAVAKICNCVSYIAQALYVQSMLRVFCLSLHVPKSSRLKCLEFSISQRQSSGHDESSGSQGDGRAVSPASYARSSSCEGGAQ